MQITILTFLTVCPLVFLAGFVDAIGGGGGLISLPAYLLAGLPPQTAIATNKLSSTVGTVFSTARYCKHGQVDYLLAIPGVTASFLGAQIGSRLNLLVDGNVFKVMLLVILPFVAYSVFRKKNMDPEKENSIPRKRQIWIIALASFGIGLYDGFYGPGTGTFLIIVYTSLAKMNALKAGGNAKLANLASNVSSLAVFLLNGKTLIPLGLAASVFSIAGHYIGSGLAIKRGGKLVRVIVIAVLILLAVKIVYDLVCPQ